MDAEGKEQRVSDAATATAEEPVEGEVVEDHPAPTEPDHLPVPAPSPSPTGGVAMTLFKTTDPVAVIEKATEVAKALKKVLDGSHLIQEITIKGRTSEHVRVEGWTLLGSMLGVYPVVRWTRPWRNSDGQAQGWEARVEAVRSDGRIVGAAEAMCLTTETRWENADEYAVRSMAQTRAVSKALGLPLRFIISMAGYNPTPAEEAEGVASGSPGQGGGQAAPTIKDPDSPATQKQIGLVSSLASKLSLEDKDRHDEASAVIKRKIHTFKQLTKGQASLLIETWKARVEAGEEGPYGGDGGGGATGGDAPPSASEPKGAPSPPTPLEENEASEWRQVLEQLQAEQLDEGPTRETALERAGQLFGNKSKILVALNRDRAPGEKYRSAKDIPAADLIRLILGEPASP